MLVKCYLGLGAGHTARRHTAWVPALALRAERALASKALSHQCVLVTVLKYPRDTPIYLNACSRP